MARKKARPESPPIQPDDDGAPPDAGSAGQSGVSIKKMLVAWRPADWGNLRDVWSRLAPASPEASQGFSPEFDGRRLRPQEVGHVFEKLVVEAFRLSQGCEVEDPFTNPPEGKVQEQIDGLVFDGWQAFLIESKNTTEEIAYGEIAKFDHAVARRPIGTLGLFVSLGGYTPATVELTKLLRPIRILLLDRFDVELAINQRDFLKIVRSRWCDAVKYGDPYLRPKNDVPPDPAPEE
jgi:hypothetical protein